jgi:hypothetical protein
VLFQTATWYWYVRVGSLVYAKILVLVVSFRTYDRERKDLFFLCTERYHFEANINNLLQVLLQKTASHPRYFSGNILFLNTIVKQIQGRTKLSDALRGSN